MRLDPGTPQLLDEEAVRTYFDRLERDHPQLLEAMRVMNISYQQYLLALQSLKQQSFFSSTSTRLTL